MGAATEAATEATTEAATETTTETAPKPLLTINQPPSWLDELIPFDLSSLSFLFPFTIPIPLPAVLITILLAVFFKGIATIALPLEVTSAVMAVVLKGLIELFGELMKVLVEDGVGVAAITES